MLKEPLGHTVSFPFNSIHESDVRLINFPHNPSPYGLDAIFIYTVGATSCVGGKPLHYEEMLNNTYTSPIA